MKTLCLALFLTFLVSLGKLNPLFTEHLQSNDDYERNAYQADEKGLITTTRDGAISCLGPWGYCLIRKYQCVSGFVIKQRFNNCPNNHTLKCCVM